MVSAGRVMLIPKGEYNALTTYNVLDMVSYNGSSYVAKTTTTGNLPTDTSKWMIMASSGAGQTFENLSDVDFSNLAEGDLPIYDSINNEWKNTPTSAVTVTNNPISITTQSAQVARDTKITLAPIQASGTPTPVNKIPIYGYDEVDLNVAGKNFLDFDKYLTDRGITYTENGNTYSVSTDANLLTNHLKFAENDIAITFSAAITNVTATNVRVVFLTKDGTVAGRLDADRPSVSFIACELYIDYSTGGTFTIANPQLEFGPTATAYEPYTPATQITHSFPTTIYGGEADVERGVLKVTHGVYTFTGTESGSTSTYGRVYLSVPAIASTIKPPASRNTPANMISEVLKATDDDRLESNNNQISYWDGKIGVCLDNTLPTGNLSDAQQAVAGTKLVYELATPYEIPLTPRLVNLLQGANVITTNGTSVTLTYREGTIATLEDIPSETVNKLADMVADVQGDISTLDSTKTDLSAIAPIEDGTTASQAYKVNEYFIRGGKLCKCISAISAGSTFTLNTNYKETTLANEIPKYTVSTTDITPGVTPLPAGQFYIVLL